MPDEEIKDIGNRVINKRKEKGLTQSQLAKKAGVDLSTLNQLEGGGSATDKFLTRISKSLDVSVSYLKYGLDEFKVGFGFNHTFAPLLLMIDENDIPSGFRLTYFMDRGDTKFYSKSEKPEYNDELEYLAAPWLIKALQKGEIDMAFVPNDTYKFNQDHLMKFFSLMNTAKGGLLALTCCTAPEKELHTYRDQFDSFFGRLKTKRTSVIFLKDTLAEDFFNSVFLSKELSDAFIPEPVEAKKSMPALIRDIHQIILEKIEVQGYDHAIFIGWEPHVTKVAKQVKSNGINSVTIDQSQFIPALEPFFQVRVDCIIKKDRFQEYMSNEQMRSFLLALQTSVRKLNELKGFRGAHYKVRRLADRLLMKDNSERAYEVLHKINFEFFTDNI